MVLIGLAVVGCTKRNPDACCTTAEECERIGFDEITPCLDLRVCVEGSCVAPDCTTSAECSAPSPYCVNTLCSPTCSGDETCVGAGLGPHCATDGTCVQCLEDAQCAASAPVCDPGTRACRACADDAECSSGICLASEGVCASEDDAVWVATGGTDTGTCTAASPCATVGYGLTQLTTARRVLRIPSVDFLADGGIVLNRDVYLDAANTRIQRDPSSEPIILVDNNATVTIEGVRLIQSTAALAINSGGRVSAYDLELDNANVTIDGVVALSELHLLRSQITSTFITCSSQATIELAGNDFTDGNVSVDACTAVIDRNHFRQLGGGTSIQLAQKLAVKIENNLMEADAGHQALFMTLSTPYGAPTEPTTIRFNTLVNTNLAAAPVVQLACSGVGAPTFSSNIVVANHAGLLSSTPCLVDHSLFDDGSGAPPGTGNVTAAAASIFVDLANSDFHPSLASGALGAADPAQAIVEDYYGDARPQPAGTTADIGAIEVP